MTNTGLELDGAKLLHCYTFVLSVEIHLNTLHRGDLRVNKQDIDDYNPPLDFSSLGVKTK